MTDNIVARCRLWLGHAAAGDGEAPGKRGITAYHRRHQGLLHAVLPCCAAAVIQDPQLHAGVVRRHLKAIGSRWRKLNPGQDALLVLAHLRKGETFDELAAGFGIGRTTGTGKIVFMQPEGALVSAAGRGYRRASCVGSILVDTRRMISLKFMRKIGFQSLMEAKGVIDGVHTRSPDEATLVYAASLLSDAREEIDRADTKASILLAASGVAAGALLAGLLAGSWTPLRLQVVIQWAWWAGIAESAIGICCFALAVYPRERKNDSGIPWSVAYYGDVLTYATTAELVTALNRSAGTSIERTADQLRHVCWIVSHKYRLLRWGMRWLFLATGTIVAAMVANLIPLTY